MNYIIDISLKIELFILIVVLLLSVYTCNIFIGIGATFYVLCLLFSLFIPYMKSKRNNEDSHWIKLFEKDYLIELSVQIFLLCIWCGLGYYVWTPLYIFFAFHSMWSISLLVEWSCKAVYSLLDKNFPDNTSDSNKESKV